MSGGERGAPLPAVELNWAPQSPWSDDGPGVAVPQPAWPVYPPGELAPSGPPGGASDIAVGPTEEPGEPEPPKQDDPKQDDPKQDDPKQDDTAKKPGLPWLRQVSFRSRISILVGAAVGIAVAMAALVSYVAVGRQLERQATTNLDNAITSATGLVHMSFQGQPSP